MTGRRSSFHTSISAVALVLTVACAKEPPPKRPPVAVNVTPVARRSVPVVVTTNGVVEPMQSVAVAAQVGGILQRVTFAEGQDVGKGQVLFEIDPRPFQAALEQARANLARDQAQAENARRDAARYQALVQKDYVTRSQAEQAAATAAATAATVQADRAAVERAQLDLNNAIVRAPISGKAGSLLVKQGNLVAANSKPPLVVINQIDPILVRFSVPQSRFPDIQRYAGGRPLSVTVTPSEGTGLPITGTLSFVDNAVDSATGTVLLKARFANARGMLWPGQFVTVQLQLFVQQNALVVPAQAVMNGQQGAYVFVVDASRKAVQRPVVVGTAVDTVVVIDKGLSDGDRVITNGQSRVSPGAVVAVKNGPGAARPRGPGQTS